MERPPGLRTAINLAAEEAAAQAEKLMEAVMKEALRKLREEFNAEMKKVKDAVRQLATSVKSQEDLCKRTTRLSHDTKQLAEALNSQQLSVVFEHLQPIHADFSSTIQQLADRVQVQEELCQRLTHEAKQHADTSESQQQSAAVDNSEAKQQADAPASQQQQSAVVEKLEALQADLKSAQFQLDFVTRRDLDRIQDQAPQHNVPPDFVTRAELDAAREATQSQLHTHREVTKELLDQKISELHGRFSDIQDERVNDHLSDLKGQVQEIQKQLSENKLRSNHEDGSESMMEVTKKVVREMRAQIGEMQAQWVEQHGHSNIDSYQTPASEMKSACFNDDLSEMKGQLRKLLLLSGSTGKSDYRPRSCLEAIKAVAMPEVQGVSEVATTQLQQDVTGSGTLTEQMHEVHIIRDQSANNVAAEMQETQPQLSKASLQGSCSEASKEIASSASQGHLDKQIQDEPANLWQTKGECMDAERGKMQETQPKSPEKGLQEEAAAS